MSLFTSAAPDWFVEDIDPDYFSQFDYWNGVFDDAFTESRFQALEEISQLETDFTMQYSLQNMQLISDEIAMQIPTPRASILNFSDEPIAEVLEESELSLDSMESVALESGLETTEMVEAAGLATAGTEAVALSAALPVVGAALLAAFGIAYLIHRLQTGTKDDKSDTVRLSEDRPLPNGPYYVPPHGSVPVLNVRQLFPWF